MAIIIAAQDSAVRLRLSALAKSLGEPIGVSVWEDLSALLGQSTAQLLVVDTSLLRDDPPARLGAVLSWTKGGAPLLLVTADLERDEDLLLEALIRGAAGCLRLSLCDDLAQQAIGIVHAGESWVDRHLLGRLVRRCAGYSEPAAKKSADENNDPASSRDKLTLREREILQQIVSGKSNKDIGRTLNISERTVKAHLTAIYRKLAVVDRVKLILLMQGQMDHRP